MQSRERQDMSDPGGKEDGSCIFCKRELPSERGESFFKVPNAAGGESLVCDSCMMSVRQQIAADERKHEH